MVPQCPDVEVRSLPESPDEDHLHPPAIICLACRRARRHTAGDWPPGWRRRGPEPWTWGEAERSCWAEDWHEVRVALGWPS